MYINKDILLFSTIFVASRIYINLVPAQDGLNDLAGDPAIGHISCVATPLGFSGPPPCLETKGFELIDSEGFRSSLQQ